MSQSKRTRWYKEEVQNHYGGITQVNRGYVQFKSENVSHCSYIRLNDGGGSKLNGYARKAYASAMAAATSLGIKVVVAAVIVFVRTYSSASYIP